IEPCDFLLQAAKIPSAHIIIYTTERINRDFYGFTGNLRTNFRKALAPARFFCYNKDVVQNSRYS
ncbi:MAG: hypothetical protein LUI14_08955, partial [Lachnospiraceae bacterium]|nr:hypothetical protein [Lachnospiraceae bacterium]